MPVRYTPMKYSTTEERQKRELPRAAHTAGPPLERGVVFILINRKWQQQWRNSDLAIFAQIHSERKHAA